MQAFMAESKDTMKRLDRLEGAIVHMTDAIVLQGERLDSLQVEIREMREAVTDRLDRLIAITTKERTMGIERLASIEERLRRLEDRVGI
jgi:septal ring factor EnvC (AmiA/AmiB activator)